MYFKERAYVYLTYLTAPIVGLFGLAFVIMSIVMWSGRTSWLYYLFYYYVPPFEWASPWLPDVGAPLGIVLLNVPTLLALILILISAVYIRHAKYYHSISKTQKEAMT
jgi:hypothetical protein